MKLNFISAVVTIFFYFSFGLNASESLQLDPKNGCKILYKYGFVGKHTKWAKANFKIGNYTHTCFSDYKTIGKGKSIYEADNIAFYADGSTNGINKIKLVANINNIDNSSQVHKEILNASEKIIKFVTNLSLKPQLIKNIVEGVGFHKKIGNVRVSLAKDIWVSGNGYSLILEVY